MERAANEHDLPLIANWLAAFHAESLPGEPQPDHAVAARARLADRRLLLWIDGEPVSIAGVTRAISGVSRVGPVYTPPEHRNHGYAAAVTAAATITGFAAGAQRCALYTDVANPTSNGVYARLGYRPVDEAVMISFEAGAAGDAGRS
jgi:predicted GNAT family acetyltransferase